MYEPIGGEKMGIMDRIKLNIRANLNYALDKAEDPQKVFDQFLADMRGNIREFKESIVNAMASVKSLEREILNSSEKVSLWDQRALLALKKGDEELAKKALERKLFYSDKERKLKEELAKQQNSINELKNSFPILEEKLEELYQKKNEMIRESIRLKKESLQSYLTAKSELNINTSVFDIYDSMVDKVKSMEDYASALSELVKSDEIEEEFSKIEKETKISEELSAMKSKVDKSV